jgi:hypothetical protein
MTKTNLEQLLEKYLKDELSGEAAEKLTRWLQVMEENRIAGSTFAMPDDERLYKLLVSSKSTFDDIDAFRPYSFDPPSAFSNPWLQLTLTLTTIVGMIAITILLKAN